MVDFSLDEDYTALRETVAAFARDVVAPVRSAGSTSAGSSPTTSCARWARWGCSACRSPRSTAAWAATTSRCAWRWRSSAKVDQRWRSRWRPAVSLGAMPVLPVRQRRAEGGVAAAADQRRGARRVRPDRARRRHRRRRHGTTAALDGGALGHQRHQAVHHQLRHRHHQLVTVTAVTGRRADGAEGDLVDPGAGADAGLHRRTGLLQGRLERLGHPSADLRRRAGCPQENLLGERGRGYANFLRILDEGRIAIAALSVGLAQGCVDECVQLRQGAGGVRPADRRATRRSPSRSPTWRPARTRPAPPTTTPPH